MLMKQAMAYFFTNICSTRLCSHKSISIYNVVTFDDVYQISIQMTALLFII